MPAAFANSFYVEAGGGVSQLRGGSTVFGPGAPAVSDLGGNFNLGVYYGLTSGKEPVGVQFGLHYRLSMGSGGGVYYSTHAPYGVIRLQVTRLFLSLGAGPMIWTRANPAPGVDGFAMNTGVINLFTEAGVLWPITREFSLGLSGSAQMLRMGGAIAPPNLDACLLMRFYYGYSSDEGAGSESRASNEWHGWRYPFGWSKKE